MAVTRKNSAQLAANKSANAPDSKAQGAKPQPSGKGSRERSLDSDQSGEPKSKKAKTGKQVAAPPRDYCTNYKTRIVSLHAELAAHVDAGHGRLRHMVVWEQYTDIVDVARAIASVTEAISLQPDPRREAPVFSVSSSGVIDAGLRTTPHVIRLVARPGEIAIFPVFIGPNHVALGILEHKAGLGYSAVYYDSWPYTRRRLRSMISGPPFDAFHETVRDMMRVGWTPRKQVARYRTSQASVVCDQVGEWVCGLHAVLSGWCLALGLTFSPTATLDEQFYEDAITIINSAVYGLVEAQLISDFLKCTGYVTPDGSPASRKFNNTVELENTTALNDLVAQIVDDDLLKAVMAESEQGD
ncbi:hypothetical protein B0A48_07408 [Cryoendolithus antarcticus]|uniref:Ubiquitin-like protease family profile domain-containing protein n=1 Tax=Cryoendolithus antarcticus TaxID=1507870 RepID=A0A1V8T8X7_9PEZI|nr:hypothetical protein B0A48_07408 [Cryoendolithus antarcticus]